MNAAKLYDAKVHILVWDYGPADGGIGVARVYTDLAKAEADRELASMHSYVQWKVLSFPVITDAHYAEDANEHPTDAVAVERQHPSQGTRLQPGSRDVGEAGVGPGETGVEGC